MIWLKTLRIIFIFISIFLIKNLKKFILNLIISFIIFIQRLILRMFFILKRILIILFLLYIRKFILLIDFNILWYNPTMEYLMILNNTVLTSLILIIKKYNIIEILINILTKIINILNDFNINVNNIEIKNINNFSNTIENKEIENVILNKNNIKNNLIFDNNRIYWFFGAAIIFVGTLMYLCNYDFLISYKYNWSLIYPKNFNDKLLLTIQNYNLRGVDQNFYKIPLWLKDNTLWLIKIEEYNSNLLNILD